MNPENTKPTDDSAPLPPPPPYMPPMDESPSPVNVQPVDSTNVASVKKPSNIPVWALVALAVFVVGVIGFYSWNWYMSNVLDKSRYMPADDIPYSNPNIDYGQQNTPEIDNNDSSTVNNCSETPDTNSVCIGDRIWMKQNLNEGVMINSSKSQTNNGVIEKYCYDNDPLKCDTYGGLYQWDEMLKYVYWNGDTSFCPTDYHVPNNNEWTNLISYLGGDTVARAKMIPGGSSGFDSIFGGYFSQGTHGNTFFADQGDATYFWSSMAGETNIESKIDANSLGLYANNDGVNRGVNWSTLPKDYALSVRCIKNLM
jgi:uncharacterized protein (TIGR02145 family)